jgi:hypothetical protein
MNFVSCSLKVCGLLPALFFLVFSCQYSQCQSTAQDVSGNLPLLFEHNVGQTDPQVQYLMRSEKYQVFLTHHAAVLKVAGRKQNAVLRNLLRNANESARVTGVDQQPARTNYLIGAYSAWRADIPNFAAVKYEGVYPGIDLKYYGLGHELEYDFDLAPGADPSRISLKIEGAQRITIVRDGSLILKTAAGEVRWRKPVAYQSSGSDRKLVSAEYRVRGNRISFKLGAYNRSKALVIDPAMVYGTFLDGSGFERYTGFKVDLAGFAYIIGETGSSDFPTTPGAYQHYTTQNFSGEVFVTKLSQDGSSVVWSTIIGGTGPNNTSTPNDFALDSEGNTYIVGQTGDFTVNDNGGEVFQTSTFPTSTGAYNRTELATWRYFLVKLNSSGSALDFSMFLSDQPNIIPYAVAIDAANNPYVGGIYNHSGGLTAPFPATAGAYQSSWAGDNDAFVMKFNSEGTALDYATLVGGLHDDWGYQISVDSAGEATIDGPTYSPNYPITPNGKRQTDEGGFITTLNSTGTALVYSTVLEHVLTIDVKRDTNGFYYAGGTAGTNLPTTANAYEKTFPVNASGVHVGFLTEIDSSGNLVYSSYLAGKNSSQFEFGDTQPQLVSSDDVTIAGNRAGDLTFPVTDRTYEQENCSYIARFNTHASSGSASLVYSGCTPINETNNMTIEQFRGIPLFTASQLYLDGKGGLYGINTNGQTSANAFQKTPPNQTSGDGDFLWFGKYDVTKLDTGGVNVSTPVPDPFPFNSIVTFQATGRSPQCSAGVAAMRVYTAPGKAAYTTQGATLDANISFPISGDGAANFNPVIVVYDNCGKAFTRNISIVVQGPPETPPNPNVVSPTNGGAVTSPVHFVASASASNCSKGIAAMRIYTAPGVSAYTVDKSSLDTYIKLAKGNYNTVVQAWDNCGNVYKTPAAITVE